MKVFLQESNQVSVEKNPAKYRGKRQKVIEIPEIRG